MSPSGGSCVEGLVGSMVFRSRVLEEVMGLYSQQMDLLIVLCQMDFSEVGNLEAGPDWRRNCFTIVAL